MFVLRLHSAVFFSKIPTLFVLLVTKAGGGGLGMRLHYIKQLFFFSFFVSLPPTQRGPTAKSAEVCRGSGGSPAHLRRALQLCGHLQHQDSQSLGESHGEAREELYWCEACCLRPS